MHITGQQAASLAFEIANGGRFTQLRVHPLSGVLTAYGDGSHTVLINPDGSYAYRSKAVPVDDCHRIPVTRSYFNAEEN